MHRSIRLLFARWVSCVSLMAALAAAPTAARAGHAPELLRTRVTEELVREGVSLAGLERALSIEARGEGVVVSITDTRTGRLVTERVVPQLPADPEAAIAHLTMLVASMVRAEHLQAGTGAATLLDGWRTAFVPAQVAAHHRPASIAVLAGGDRRGEPGAAVISATQALAAAYRAAGIGLVAEGEGLGDLSSLDDAAIVGRAASLPVAVVAVVRVFTGGPKLRAVVSLYDKTGALVTAYTATTGEPIRPPQQEAGPSQGVTSSAVDAVLKEHDSHDKARREYARRMVTTSWFGMTGGGTAYATPVFFAGNGDEKRQVSGADFYRAVGRDDLAKSYRRRRYGGVSAIVLGSVGFLAGLGFVDHSNCRDKEFPEYDQCKVDRESEGTAGGVLMLGGTATVIFGIWFMSHPHPVDERDRPALAQQHNARLRRELGLPEETDEASEKPKAENTALSIQWAPYATQNGGGLHVLLRF